MNKSLPKSKLDKGRLANHAGMVLGPLAIVLLISQMAGWTGYERVHPLLSVFSVLATSLPYALLWLGAAMGLGWPLRRLLIPDSPDGLAIQSGLGVAFMLFLDSALGRSGLLQMGGNFGPWIPLGVGLAFLAEQFRRWMRASERPELVWPWPLWTVVPALAVLILASCSAPGWLWATEFGGYDAMSYHLQLPGEWLRIGSITPLQHNVYSFMPSFMESAYYHLALLMGDHLASVCASQMLHGMIAVLAAVVVGRIGHRLAGPLGGIIAGVITLGTPWIIVVGSLGYNEMVVVLLLATGYLALEDQETPAPRSAVLLGIIIGAACGAKLTSVGFVALPLLMLLLWKYSARRWPVILTLTALTSLCILLPYLIANTLSTGNPVFPFATNIFSSGHWTTEQAATWTLGHSLEGGFTQTLTETFNQFFRYGLGPTPYQGEPWIPQWSILPFLSTIGLTLALASKRMTRSAQRLVFVLVVQGLFWMFFTHIKSRFMVPAVVPLALGVTVAYALLHQSLTNAYRKTQVRICICIALLAWSFVPLLIFSQERNASPSAMIDWVGLNAGIDLKPQQRQEVGRTDSAAIYINYVLDDESRILLIGQATPLYITREITYQTTWDRGPMSQVMREFPEDRSAWIAGLRELGFTHLLVVPNMLRNWEKAGWNDPLITADRILNAADLYATLEINYPNGTRIYRLLPPGTEGTRFFGALSESPRLPD